MKKKWDNDIVPDANKAALITGKETVPSLEEIDFYGHYMFHLQDSNIAMYKQIDNLGEIRDTVYYKQLFKKVKKNGRGGKTSLIVRKKVWKMYKEVLAQERIARKEKPQTMLLYTPSYEIDFTVGHGFVNANRPISAINLPTMFLGKRP